MLAAHSAQKMCRQEGATKVENALVHEPDWGTSSRRTRQALPILRLSLAQVAKSPPRPDMSPAREGPGRYSKPEISDIKSAYALSFFFCASAGFLLAGAAVVSPALRFPANTEP